MEEDNFLFRNEKKLDAEKVKLAEIFNTPKQKFTYIYDFGDDWIHELLLEKITDEKILRAACTDGKGVCPPEDCGGPWGFANLKEILSDTKHPKHYETKGWLGLSKKDKWDAEAFDMEGTNERVNKV